MSRKRRRRKLSSSVSPASPRDRFCFTRRRGEAEKGPRFVSIPPMTDSTIQNKLFINGEFVDAQSGQTFATTNPATEEKITDIASAGEADVDAAVRAARAQMEPG